MPLISLALLPSAMYNEQRTIHLTEVSATDFPAANDYKYKCRLQVISDQGQPLLHKDLLTRTQPSWLADLKNKGDCMIALTLCYREGDITQPWQDAGTVTFATQDCLNGERKRVQQPDTQPAEEVAPPLSV